jgi:hypothetical protein
MFYQKVTAWMTGSKEVNSDDIALAHMIQWRSHEP